MSYDIIIIGAGMSGIAAGIRLAYYEKKVCILEKHSRAGGLNSYYTKNGRKLDVGLHAMTNYVKKGTKKAPFSKLLRQLRLSNEDFSLKEQKGSSIDFPGVSLLFDNDPETLRQDIIRHFPNQEANFNKLCIHINEFDALNLSSKPLSSREILGSFISDPLLVEMLMCPLSFYGSAREYDMDFDQFVILFKSIFLEGFARPEQGVRRVLDVLLKKYRSCGGELRLKTGVQQINSYKGVVSSVTLENGEILETDIIISSAGFVETMELAGQDLSSLSDQVGRLSFVETIYALNKEPMEYGIDKTITFYNNSEQFAYRKPESLIDTSSGVICCPNNFNLASPLPEGMIRVTHMANHDLWNMLSPEEYKKEKEVCQNKSLEAIGKIIPDFSSSIVFHDMFTPKTIERYTGHYGGAVYGTPQKKKNGETCIKNLFICGTDQGFLGIVGAMLSGISMANLHALQ